MVNFISDEQQKHDLHIPFFEDITAKDIPGCRTEKSVKTIQGEITAVLKRLDCWHVQFQSGKVEGEPMRYGFQIHFTYMGAPGRIDCVALPMREEFPKRKEQALAQALYLVRNALEAQLYAKYYQPGFEPILPYMMDDKGVTVMQKLVGDVLPMLSAGG